MKRKTKILILITDGISLRNFVYTNLSKSLNENGHEVVFWHTTPFDIENLGYNEIKLNSPKLHPVTTSFKNAKKFVELSQFEKASNETIFKKYWFPLRNNNFKQSVKNSLSSILIWLFNSKSGVLKLRKYIRSLERRTKYYKHCLEILEEYNPDVVYNTSQRSVLAIAPIEAAKSLNIPTLGFIYSWDNLPKATLDVETDYYHVWSDYMKEELLKYYPFVNSKLVIVTGTPQFEPHYDSKNLLKKDEFYSAHKLKKDYTYICFSGDDITTSPQDPLYLRDIANAIRQLNSKGRKLGVIFRRCPVDFSNRYDVVLDEYSDVVHTIDPIWEKKLDGWNSIFPVAEDAILLNNIAQHCAAVINLGSSMVFDFAIHHRPCAYMNYTYSKDLKSISTGVHVYDYMHFRSMPAKDVVVWLNHPSIIQKKLEDLIDNPNVIIERARSWFSIINEQPAENASGRIISHVDFLINS